MWLSLSVTCCCIFQRLRSRSAYGSSESRPISSGTTAVPWPATMATSGTGGGGCDGHVPARPSAARTSRATSDCMVGGGGVGVQVPLPARPLGTRAEPVHVGLHGRGLRCLRLECRQEHSKQGNQHHRHDEFLESRPSSFTERPQVRR